MSNLTHPNYRSDIDGLRAIAVMSVIGFHSFPGWFKGGYIGVDIFFVISGFLISSIIFENIELERFSYAEFYAHRIRRIFPALSVVLATCLLYGWFFMLPFEFSKIGKHVFGGAVFISNLLLWGESGYFDVVAEHKPLLHLWSLGVEEQFYILWPLLLGVFWKHKKNFLLITVFVFLFSFAINIALIFNSPVAAFYSPVSRFWELMIGGGLAYMTSHMSRNKVSLATRNIQSATGLFLILVSIVMLTRLSSFPGWWALLPTIGTFFLIWGGTDTWVNTNILSNRALVSVGLVSYPLYLWHWPALYIANQLPYESPTEVRLIRGAAILISLILAYLTFIWIEKPTRNQPAVKMALLLSSAMSVVALFGLYVFISGGVGTRYPELIADAGKTKIQAEWREHVCYLQPGDDGYSQECIGPARPLLFVWGDSHAAALYPGFKEFGKKFNVGIGQATASACPPLLNWERSGGNYCSYYNQQAFKNVSEHKPEVVAIYANWDGKTNVGYDLSKLGATVDRIKSSGVASIVLIGPAPQWNEDLPKALWKCYGNTEIPSYSKCEASITIPDLDLKMKEIARGFEITYISLYNEMCNENGCLVKIGDKLVSQDYGHLTPEASRFLIKKISARLMDILAPNLSNPRLNKPVNTGM